MAGRTQGGFSPCVAPEQRLRGNDVSQKGPPEALLRGYTRGNLPAGSSPKNSPCPSLNRIGVPRCRGDACHRLASLRQRAGRSRFLNGERTYDRIFDCM